MEGGKGHSLSENNIKMAQMPLDWPQIRFSFVTHKIIDMEGPKDHSLSENNIKMAQMPLDWP